MPKSELLPSVVNIVLELFPEDFRPMQDLEDPGNTALGRAKVGKAEIFLFAAAHKGPGERIRHVQAIGTSYPASWLHLEHAKKLIDGCRDLEVSDPAQFVSMYKDEVYALPVQLTVLPLFFGDKDNTFYGWVAVSGNKYKINHAAAFAYACRFWNKNRVPHLKAARKKK